MKAILKEGKLTSADYQRFLRSEMQASKVLDVLNREVATFKRNYVIVKGYLDQTATRLESLCKQGLQHLYETFKHANYHVDQRMLAALQLAVEWYDVSCVRCVVCVCVFCPSVCLSVCPSVRLSACSACLPECMCMLI
jgi:hypothetical protein